MLVKKTIQEEVQVNFPVFRKYGGDLIKIISERNYIAVKEDGIEVKEGYPSTIQLYYSDGTTITEEQFNEVFEVAFDKIKNSTNKPEPKFYTKPYNVYL